MINTGVGVLDKLVQILACFEKDALRLTPKDVSAETGIPLATAYRLMQAMADHGLLSNEKRTFSLGYRLAGLGARMIESIDLRGLSAPILNDLARDTGENVNLSIRQDTVRVLIHQVASQRNVRPFAMIGEPLPLGFGAAGIVLLAWLPPEEALDLAKRSAAQFGYSDSPLLDTLHERLSRTRNDGYAVSFGERKAEVGAIAAPIRDSFGTIVAAVSVVAPSNRLGDAEVATFAPLVVAASGDVSRKLGAATGG